MALYLIITCVTIALAATVKQTHLTKENYAFGVQRGTWPGVTRCQGMNILSLTSIFLTLFLPAALRIQVGNDYESYVDTIHEIYVGGYVVTEPLFHIIVKGLCELAGGENYLLVFGFFSFITIWIFLKAIYEQTDDFFLSFFLFMTLGIYFRTYNTMRYYFVLGITIYSYRYILRKEYIKFIFLILLSSLLHKSVLVVIPLYFIAVIPWKRWFIFLLIIGAGLAVAFSDIILEMALYLYPSYKNTVFLQSETGIMGNVATIARCILVLLFASVTYKEGIKGKKENLFYLKLNVLALLIYSCGSFLPLVGRIGYYLITSQVLFIPSVLSCLEKGKKKNILLCIVILSTIFYFMYFLKTADQPGVRVLPYRTWLFYEKEFLNAETIF